MRRAYYLFKSQILLCPQNAFLLRVKCDYITCMLLLQDLEASLAASMSREKETMEQTAALEKEKENLARELASYINKEKDKVDMYWFVFMFYRV